MKRIALGSLLAALAIFVFGAAFWTCPIPYAYVEKSSAGDAEMGQLLRNALPNDGLYLVPSRSGDANTTEALYRQGPVATIHYRREGADVMAPSMVVGGFFHGWVTTFLLAVLLHLAARPRFGERVLLVALAGVAITNYTVLGGGIYWFHPWPWLLLNAAYDATTFLIVGIVLAAVVTPRHPPHPSPADAPKAPA